MKRLADAAPDLAPAIALALALAREQLTPGGGCMSLLLAVAGPFDIVLDSIVAGDPEGRFDTEAISTVLYDALEWSGPDGPPDTYHCAVAHIVLRVAGAASPTGVDLTRVEVLRMSGILPHLAPGRCLRPDIAAELAARGIPTGAEESWDESRASRPEA